MRSIETRVIRIEERQRADRRASFEAGQAYAHLSRAEVVAAIRAKVTDMLTCRTMGEMRALFAARPDCLAVLDIIEVERNHATH